MMASEAADPHLRPRVAAPGPLTQPIQRGRYGAVRLLSGKAANQLADLRAGPPSMLPGAVAGNTQAGVIAAAPVHQEFDAVLDRGGDDLSISSSTARSMMLALSSPE
ncbi:MAG: hypothetical protein OXT64_02430 [Gammaproteobacteria bacterium]|nr:hypothetical protein [Gammaproteobacteria bacterium]